MISPIYARQILNALFHTKGGEGLTAETELSNLTGKYPTLKTFWVTETKNGKDTLVSVYGISPSRYLDAYVDDGYKTNGTNTTNLNNTKTQVTNEKKQWYRIVTCSEELKSGTMTEPKTFTGWYLKKNDVQAPPYPEQGKTYLGLFTKMPNGQGAEFEEPTADEYMRVNLHESIVTGETTIGAAAEDDKTGITAIVNSGNIMFPEITTDGGWGTIVGFGIFENKKPVTGEIPILWGVLKTKEGGEDGEDVVYTPTTVPTSAKHVPLFRKDDFTVSLG